VVLAFGLSHHAWLSRWHERDYSYGIYIYAFPVQQSLVSFWPQMPLVPYLLSTLTITIALAAASWHFVEKPFRSKNRISPRLVAILSISIGSFLIVIGAITSKLETNFEKTMAEELSTSQAIFVTNVNERIFIKNRIDVENISPDTLIIGSSRIMQIGNHNNQGINLNLSVSGASVEDILAISYLANNKYRPAKIYISADPWLFNLNSGQGRWSALSAAYEAEIKNLGINRKLSDTPDKSPLPFNRLFAKVYTRVTVNQIVAADDRSALIDKIRKDGSRVYNVQYANESSATVEREASGAPGYAMKNYEYSESARDQLESLLKKLRVKSSICLILSPYHPTAFEIMQRENLPHLQIEQMYRDIANRTGVQIVGSYDPAVVGCSKFEFFDGMHPKGSCMKKVLLGSQSR
jgi:hypothetical protein